MSAPDKMRSLADMCSRAGAVCGEGLLAEVVRLRADLDACRTWQAKRVVAISQDPTCIKWMRESEQLGEENDRLRAAVDAVRALHQPYPLPPMYECAGCGNRWPCPTTTALAAAGVPEATEAAK